MAVRKQYADNDNFILSKFYFLVLKVNRLEKKNHFLTEEHQHALLNAIRHLSNESNVQHEKCLAIRIESNRSKYLLLLFEHW